MTLPVFSPDGRKIAYALRHKGMLADVWVSDADGSNPVQITNTPGPDHMPSWRRDSRTVLFASLRDGKPELWEYSLSTARERRVAGFGDRKVMARLSPDEKSLIYHAGPEGALQIWKMDLATGAETQITRDPEAAGYPLWSPDGKQVAFEIFRDGDTHLAVTSAEGAAVRQLTNQPGHAWPFSWAPDGRIAIAARWDGMWNLYTVHAETGAIRKLTGNDLSRVFLRYPSWAPGARSIVYERNETKGNLFVAEPAASAPPEKK
jgi:TolB protein